MMISTCLQGSPKESLRYRAGELEQFDCVRRYGVIVGWAARENVARSHRRHFAK